MNNAQELADLVKTKHKVIEELKNSLVEARNCVSAMEEEICSLQANRAEAEDEEHGEQMTHCVSTYNLENIHERYTKVLGILNKEQCSMANAFQLARCPCSTKSKSMSPANMLVQSSSWSWHVADVCDGIYHCWPPCKGRADYFHWPLIQVLFPIIPMFDNSRFPVNISGSMFDFTRTQTWFFNVLIYYVPKSSYITFDIINSTGSHAMLRNSNALSFSSL